MMINKALCYIRDNLDMREKEILIMRYGLGNTEAYTQREVAKKLGISRSSLLRTDVPGSSSALSQLHSQHTDQCLPLLNDQ